MKKSLQILIALAMTMVGCSTNDASTEESSIIESSSSISASSETLSSDATSILNSSSNDTSIVYSSSSEQSSASPQSSESSTESSSLDNDKNPKTVADAISIVKRDIKRSNLEGCLYSTFEENNFGQNSFLTEVKIDDNFFYMPYYSFGHPDGSKDVFEEKYLFAIFNHNRYDGNLKTSSGQKPQYANHYNGSVNYGTNYDLDTIFYEVFGKSLASAIDLIKDSASLNDGDLAFSKTIDVGWMSIGSIVFTFDNGEVKEGCFRITDPSGNTFMYEGKSTIESYDNTVIDHLWTYDDECKIICNKDKTIMYDYADKNATVFNKLPKSVETIEIGAFQNCVNLEDITIPNTIKRLDPEVFHWFLPDKTINYSGTKEQLASTQLICGWNSSIKSFSINCLDGVKSFQLKGQGGSVVARNSTDASKSIEISYSGVIELNDEMYDLAEGTISLSSTESIDVCFVRPSYFADSTYSINEGAFFRISDWYLYDSLLNEYYQNAYLYVWLDGNDDEHYVEYRDFRGPNNIFLKCDDMIIVEPSLSFN